MKSDVNRPVPNAPDMSGHAYPTHFPLSLAKRSGETAVSFAGRLALKNGYSCLQEMCADQSIQLRSLCNGQAQEIRRIAELAGSEFDKLHFDTPTLTKPGWFDLGREQIKFTSFARMGGQICPTCISEDRAMVPQIFGHQKGVWQISALRSCHEHSVLLEQNDVKGSSKWVHDFALHVRDWSPSEVTQIPPDSMTLEHYLADRIQHGRRSEWLDRFEFHVVSQFCEALGTLLKFGPDARPHQLAPEEIVKAGAAGFDIARGGADAILLKLDDIRQQSPKSSRPDYAALFGPVFANLRERRNDPDFSFLRKVLRDYILDNYYVPEGTSLLGEVCGAPRALTLGIASKHYGTPVSLLTRQLRLDKQIGDSPPAQCTRSLTLPRATLEKVVASVRKLSSIRLTREILGADRYTMERLVNSGLIELHFSADDGGQPLIHADEIRRFVDRMRAKTAHRTKLLPDWVPLADAARQCHCTVHWLIKQIVEGNLRCASTRSEPFHLAEFYVSVSQLREHLDQVPNGFVTVAQAATLLGCDAGSVHALAEHGYLNSRLQMAQLANRKRRLIPLSNLVSFEQKYILLRPIRGSRRASFDALRRILSESGIAPLALGARTREFFKRDDLERLAYRPGGSAFARLLADDDTNPRVSDGVF